MWLGFRADLDAAEKTKHFHKTILDLLNALVDVQPSRFFDPFGRFLVRASDES